MAGRVIGTATVEVKADTQGFRGALDGIGSQLGGGVRKLSGAVAGIGFLDKAQDAIEFGAETTMALDNAKAMFRGLTDSEGEADDMLRRLTQYAINTPFELTGVAGMAAQLVAVGDGFGVTTDNVTGFLDTIGNVTAASGGTEDTMARIVRVLGQMSGTGKVLGQDMNQLAQNIPGLDVWGALAKGTGKSEQELRALQDAGKLDELLDGNEAVEILLGAMNEFPGAAGAMERRMDTLEGSMSKFKEQLGLTLSQGLEPFFDTLQKVMGDPRVQKAIQELATAFGELASELVDQLAPVLPDLIDAFKEILIALKPAMPLIVRLVQIFADMLVALAPLITVLAEFLGWIADLLAAMPPSLLAAIAAALATLWLVGFGPVGAVVAAIVVLGIIITKNWDTIVAVTQTMVDGVVAAWDWLFEHVFQPVADFVMAIVGFFTGLYDALVGNSIIPDLINGIIEWFGKLWALIEFVIGVFTDIYNAIAGVVSDILGFVSLTVSTIKTVVVTIFNEIASTLDTIWNGIKTVASTVWEGIKTVILTPIETLQGLLDTIVGVIKTLFGFAGLGDIVSGVWEEIKGFILSPIETLEGLLDTIVSTIKTLFSFAGLVDIVSGVWTGIKDAILGALNELAGLIPGIVDKILGPLDEIAGAVGGAVGAVGGAAKGVTGKIPGTPWAKGGIYWGTSPLPSVIHGPEAMIPLTNPGRAMQIMQQAGLDRLAAQMNRDNGSYNGPLVTMPGAIIQDATDADLVAQRTLVAMQAAMVA